jgi:hypothetical protein
VNNIQGVAEFWSYKIRQVIHDCLVPGVHDVAGNTGPVISDSIRRLYLYINHNC